MQYKPKKAKKIILAILIILFGSSAIYLGNYYHSVDVEKYMASSSEVTIKKFDKGWFFDGAGEEKALIFYPGAKVATEAYAPLMYQLAENGVDCFLVEMPFHMAFFGMNRAEEIMQKYNYEAWYLGGHSLGGAMAANFVAGYVEDHADGIRGLLLLAAYPTKDLSSSDMSVVTVYGSEDGVLNMDKLWRDGNLCHKIIRKSALRAETMHSLEVMERRRVMERLRFLLKNSGRGRWRRLSLVSLNNKPN